MNSLWPCKGVVDLLFPPGACALCGRDSSGGPFPGICRTCWRGRSRPAPPLCPLCGDPLPPVEGQEPHVCGKCLKDRPPFIAHVSVFTYEGPVKALLRLYKDRRRYRLAEPMGRALAGRVRGRWPEAKWDGLVYVPSPLGRRMVRGFEPAGLIASVSAGELRLPLLRALRAKGGVREQRGLGAAERRVNVRGAFALRSVRVKGLRLLLVDDVKTTGATLRQSAGVLKRAGAKVHAATVAAAVRRKLDLVGGENRPLDQGEDHG